MDGRREGQVIKMNILFVYLLLLSMLSLDSFFYGHRQLHGWLCCAGAGASRALAAVVKVSRERPLRRLGQRRTTFMSLVTPRSGKAAHDMGLDCCHTKSTGVVSSGWRNKLQDGEPRQRERWRADAQRRRRARSRLATGCGRLLFLGAHLAGAGQPPRYAPAVLYAGRGANRRRR